MDILLVDDNPLMQQLMARFLGDLGYRISVAGSAAEAIALARQNPPALFLIDLYLPDSDGREALLALREIPGCAATPAIAMSGLSESEAKRYITKEFVTYLPKPVELDIVEATVARYLQPSMTRSVG